MIDLDHNATTPLHPRVRAGMVESLSREDLGNPSSQHRRGQSGRAVVETARRQVAEALGVQALGVTFTSGGTEAANLAVLGVARALRAAGRPHGVLTSPLEHPAVGSAVARLEAAGHPVVRLPVDAQGRIDPGALEEQLLAHPEVGLVTLAAANHELGNVYDIGTLVAVAKAVRPELLVHCDAVQAVGKVSVSVPAWGVDLLSLSAHKLGGPVGVGALVHSRGLRVQSLMVGGGQERGRRAGTESALLAHGLGLATALAVAEQPERHAQTSARREQLLEGLRDLGARIHGDSARSTGNTVNAAFAGCEGQLVMMSLDLVGIAVSTGAACSSGAAEPSPVLLALGQAPEQAREALRFSLAASTTAAEIEAVSSALAEILPRVRRAGSRRSAS